ncbi:MAG: tRNA epoxyqueuosine(34) reductase QueG [Mariprofundus sp.]|nr:tRNA epoxyqueuosine(34) reductase QueG [Mariprofundus sp.]
MKEQIQLKAREHGFDRCYVSKPCVDQRHLQSLQNWVDMGMHAEMAWMAEELRLQRRMEPMQLLAGVQSVISVALCYKPPEYTLTAAASKPKTGVISAYAHGDDYHDVMKKRLKALALDLDLLFGKHEQRVFVDTAPVLEHALAESGGLGWQGKHSLTIHQNLGSWFLLGEIFTTADIEADLPAANHCGSCSACMTICPTQAIVAPYVVDARLCISYLTIEFDGFIPHPLRVLMGNRIYGCDDCQLICPWNGHAAKKTVLLDDLLKPRGENDLPDLAALLQLDEEAFRARFRKSPIKRTKRRGLLRNVCIAMGNAGDAQFIPCLMAVLDDEEPLIRGHAAWALGQLVDQVDRADTLAALVQMLEIEKESTVRREVELAIQHIRMSDE